MNRTQIYLPRKHIGLLRSEAAKKQTTVSGIIRMILEKSLEPARSRRKERPRETLLGFAERMKRMGMRGPRDLASKTDEYLYGARQ